MSSNDYRLRRATLDDKESLAALWNSMRLPVEELYKRITEFQVAEGPDGVLVAALGFQMSQQQGRIHSECYGDFGLADRLRPLFWERIQAISTNHGLLRLWTQEQSPFWKQQGLQPPNAEALKKLPPEWEAAAADWLTLGLRTEEAFAALEREMALHLAADRERLARTMERARLMKTTVTVFAFLLAIATFAAAAYLYFHRTVVGHGH
jgi:N-acetylglutamate synthase-like GNAT family acetyltransferase